MTVTVTVPSTMSSDGLVHTYTDDSSPTTGLDGGGHVTRLLPLILDNLSIANYAIAQNNAVVANADAAATSASNAAASATSAASMATSLTGTSSTTLTFSTGSKSLYVQTGKQFATGQFVTITNGYDANTYMYGSVIGYSSGTGLLSVNISDTFGSAPVFGADNSWKVSVSGIKGVQGTSANSGMSTNIKGILYGDLNTLKSISIEEVLADTILPPNSNFILGAI